MGRIIKSISMIFRKITKAFSSGKISFGKKLNIHPKARIVAYNGAEVVFGNNIAVAQNCMVYADGNACLTLENEVSLSRGVQLYSREKIVVGSGTMIGNNTLVFDHDHDYKCPGGVRAGKYKSAPVIIGKNVWIGCNVSILSGTTIGDNCVIGAGAVIKGDFPANSVVYQKRELEVKPYKFEG